MLLDENAGPTPLPLSLLEDITNNFSSVHEIGRGGFARAHMHISSHMDREISNNQRNL